MPISAGRRFSRSMVAATSGGSDRKPCCPGHRQQRPQLRTAEPGGGRPESAGRQAVQELIENQHSVTATRPTRTAPSSAPPRRSPMPAPGPMASSSAIRASFPSAMPAARKIAEEQQPNSAPAAHPALADRRRQQRHRPDRDRHREQIGQDRHRAAQQPGVEAGDHGNRPVRDRRRHRNCSWTTPVWRSAARMRVRRIGSASKSDLDAAILLLAFQ